MYYILGVFLQHRNNLLLEISLSLRWKEGRTGIQGRTKGFPLSRCQTQLTRIENIRKLARLYHSFHGDEIRRLADKIGLEAFHCGAKQKDGQRIRVLLLPQGVDRGSQRAVLQPSANLILDARM